METIMNCKSKILIIIVPAFNLEKYIEECIESLLSQYNGRFEIVLVDDGSNDNTPFICDKISSEFSFVLTVHTHNHGVSSARNTGIKAAKGEYITFVDGDDWVSPDYIKNIFDIIDSEDFDVLMFNYIRCYHQKTFPVVTLGNEKLVFKFKNSRENFLLRKLIGPYTKDEINKIEQLDSLVSACTKVYKKSIVENETFENLDDIGTGEDLLFNLAVFCKAEKYIYIPGAYYFYRKTRASSTTHVFKDDFLDRWSNLYSKIESYSVMYSDFAIAFENRKALSFLSYGLYIDSVCGTYKNKKNAIKQSLNHNFYLGAFDHLNYKNMKLRNRLFFESCKKKRTVIIALMLMIANRMRGTKK